MSPIQAKVAVPAFGLLSLTLVAAAVREWSSGDVESNQPAPARVGWRGALILLGVSGAVVVGLLVAASRRPWPPRP